MTVWGAECGLQDAGHDSLLVARVADMNYLPGELESLLEKNL
ncbi:hypothetical protein [Dolichospermum planctonicum]|nr:hypothetical protein [Dolichospermum planctonicum]